MHFPTIALVDSGVGGLHLLEALRRSVQARYLYFADTKHMPYGNKSNNEIIELSSRVVTFLATQKPDVIIIACHTISAHALDQLKKIVEIPIIGMIDLVCNAALQTTKNNRIGILATPATIASHAHAEFLQAIAPNTHVIEQPCQELAARIEADPCDSEIEKLIHAYLQPVAAHAVDTLIIGCTHYEADNVLLCIKKKISPNVSIIKASDGIAISIKNVIKTSKNAELLRPHIYVTGSLERFLHSANVIIPGFSSQVDTEQLAW